MCLIVYFNINVPNSFSQIIHALLSGPNCDNIGLPTVNDRKQGQLGVWAQWALLGVLDLYKRASFFAPQNDFFHSFSLIIRSQHLFV